MAKTLEELQALIKDGETLKVRASERRNSLRPQYQKKIDEIKALGFNPNNIEQELKIKEKEVADLILKATELIPEDIINKYKNYDFAGAKEEKEPNLDLPF